MSVESLIKTICSFQFGESQSLRLVRILRSTVMVRVGGGWTALNDFLIRHDPCRGKSMEFERLNVFFLRFCFETRIVETL